jgi:hypothetical protein
MDNLLINISGGTATVRTKDESGVHTQAFALAVWNGSAIVFPSGDAAQGLDVDVTRLPALPVGTNNIGIVELGATTLAALETITASGPLTDAQLRASPVEISGFVEISAGTLELGATSLAALENITVGGTVELGATSLAALETVTASGPLTDAQLRAALVPVGLLSETTGAFVANFVQVGGSDGATSFVLKTDGSGALELGSATLTALENLVVSGTLELGATSLTALENITVGGTVELGATSLAALESVTTTGPVTDAQLRATPIAANPSQNRGKTVTRVVVAQGAAGSTQLAAASAGNKHKVVGWVLAMDAAGTLKFNSATAGDLTGAYPVAASGGFVVAPAPECPFVEGGANEALNLITTVGKAFGVVLLVTEP